MAQFYFKCQQCGETVVVDDSLCGQVLECPSCGAKMAVPRSVTSPDAKVRLRSIHREDPMSQRHHSANNGEFRPTDSLWRDNDPAVPLSAAGSLHKNEERIRDAFSREVNTIRGTANVMLIREIIIFITAGLVIAGTIGCIWYNYRKKSQSEQIVWQRELERRKLLEEDRARSIAERKRAQEEEALARTREHERIEAEKKAKEEARKAAEVRRKKYAALAKDYSEFQLDYLQNAPRAILPDRAKVNTTYSCLMSDDVEGVAFFRVAVMPGKPMTVQRLSADTEPIDVPVDIFNMRCRTESYLMIAGGRPYVSPWKKPSRFYPIPRTGEKFNPAMEDLGSSLYKIIKDFNLKTEFIRYDVFLQPKDEYKFELEPLYVGQIGFDDGFSLDALRVPIRAKLEKSAQVREEAYRRMVASRGSAGSKTRAHEALERNLTLTEAESKTSYTTHHTTAYPIPGHNIIYQSQKERSGPSRRHAEKIENIKSRLAAEEKARLRREEATLLRRAQEDRNFERENAVTEQVVDEHLRRYMVTFRLAK